MKNLRMYALAIVAFLAFAGCGNESSITAPEGTTGAVSLAVADPLEGVLNSTDGTTPTEHGRRLGRLAEVLGLSEEQKAAVSAAFETFHEGVVALRAQVRAGTLTIEAAHEAAALLRADFEAALQVILTEEQWNKLQEMRQKRDGNGNGHRDPQDRWIAWLTRIGADEGQISDVLAQMEIVKGGMKSLHEQLRAGTITPQEAREQARAIRDAFEAAIEDILTPEQYAALLELRPDCMGPHRRPPGPGRP